MATVFTTAKRLKEAATTPIAPSPAKIVKTCQSSRVKPPKAPSKQADKNLVIEISDAEAPSDQDEVMATAAPASGTQRARARPKAISTSVPSLLKIVRN